MKDDVTPLKKIAKSKGFDDMREIIQVKVPENYLLGYSHSCTSSLESVFASLIYAQSNQKEITSKFILVFALC